MLDALFLALVAVLGALSLALVVLCSALLGEKS
jgi:hypothetical protein